MANSTPLEYHQRRFLLPPGGVDLLLVRHGESAPGRLDTPFPFRDNYADPPLDPRGQAEAGRVAKRLSSERIAAIYVSPLQRARQTAAPLCEQLGIDPHAAPDLREVNLGEWEGVVYRARMHEGHPIAKRVLTEGRWDAIPGAELMEDFTARVTRGLTAIANRHLDERVAVFTHGGVIAVAAALATHGRPFSFAGADNASINHIVLHRGRWILRRFNDTGHLSTDLDNHSRDIQEQRDASTWAHLM